MALLQYLVHVCAGILVQLVAAWEDDESNLTVAKDRKLVRFLHHPKLPLVKRHLQWLLLIIYICIMRRHTSSQEGLKSIIVKNVFGYQLSSGFNPDDNMIIWFNLIPIVHKFLSSVISISVLPNNIQYSPPSPPSPPSQSPWLPITNSTTITTISASSAPPPYSPYSPSPPSPWSPVCFFHRWSSRSVSSSSPSWSLNLPHQATLLNTWKMNHQPYFSRLIFLIFGCFPQNQRFRHIWHAVRAR